MPNPLAHLAAFGTILTCVVQVMIIAALLVGGPVLAYALGPEPYSDWAYYWLAAGDPSAYQRGGLGLWVLAFPKYLGLGPVTAALLLNVPAALLLLWMAFHGGRAQWSWIVGLLAAYLIMLVPFLGLVQLDLLAAAALGLAAFLILAAPNGVAFHFRLAGAILACTFAVSTKPQYALVLWAMLSLLALPWWLWRGRTSCATPALLGVFALGSIFGVAVDMGQRVLSGQTEAIRTSSAVTIYGGLLVSRIERCGYWSAEAARAAQTDLDRPLTMAIFERLSAQPPGHWISIMRCKLPQIVVPPAFATYWLVESPNVRARLDGSAESAQMRALYSRVLHIERRVYAVLTTFILLAALWSSLRLWMHGAHLSALMLPAWVSAFWAVHLVFEIQGRYFLGLFVLSALFSILLMRVWPPSPSRVSHEASCGRLIQWFRRK